MFLQLRPARSGHRGLLCLCKLRHLHADGAGAGVRRRGATITKLVKLPAARTRCAPVRNASRTAEQQVRTRRRRLQRHTSKARVRCPTSHRLCILLRRRQCSSHYNQNFLSRENILQTSSGRTELDFVRAAIC